MKNNQLFFSLSFIVIFLCSFQGHGALITSPESIENLKKINTVNLLLPIIYENLDTRAIQYTLKGYNGCFEWFSSQPQVLNIKGYEDKDAGCHSQALVSLATNKPYNNVIWITAKDRETHDTFKCESRVTKVARIEILTKLRTIDVGNVEILEVLGYDEEGNVFSTLEGMRFEWSIPSSEASNLEFVSIKDSAIKTTELRKKIESSNFQTDIIVVRGLRTGKATVSVRVKERDYGKVEHSVVLYVIEHFVIYPDYEVYVLPYSSVTFYLSLIKSDLKNSTHIPVALPSKNHQWNNLNPTRASVDDTGVVNCLGDLGDVKIQVRDRQMINNTVDNTIHIVAPYSIDIQIREFTSSSWESIHSQNIFEKGKADIPFDNVWNLIQDREYYLRAFLYDDKMNQIHITPNVQIKFAFDSNNVQVMETRNHEVRIKPTKLGDLNKLTVSLEEVRSAKGVYQPKTAIRSSKDFKIISKISIVRPDKNIHLPIIEGEGKTVINQQTFKLYAIGGSKRYEWVSRDLSVATIGHEAAIFPKKAGETVIEVRDILNSKNMDQIEVEVSEISEFEFLEKMGEIIVNTTGHVSFFALGGRNRRRYSNCSSLQIQTAVENPSLVSRVAEDLTYEQYLEYLETIYNGNEHYREQLRSYRNDEYLNIAQYEKQILSKAIDEEQLRNIFKQYRNYGMCSRVVFRGEFKGETSVRAYYNDGGFNRRAVSLEELRLRVYDNFITLEPLLTYRTSHPLEVLLTIGSSFTWELKGGPIKWEDTRKLNTDISTVSLTDSKVDILSTKPLSSSKSKKIYNVQCTKPATSEKRPYSYILKISSGNDADYRLPNPVKLQSELRVSCKDPTTMEIYILREEDSRLDVNTVQRAIGETFTIRNNEYYNFQTWVFDEHKRPFYNFSSLKVDWELDPPGAGDIADIRFPASEKVLSISEDQYKRVKITATEGEAHLKAFSDKYDPKFLIVRTFDRISDVVSINVKGDIELNPSQYVLYNNPENSFEIHITRGSGDFAVSINDTSIAKINYNRQTQTITVSPLKLGFAQVIVEDRKLVSSKRATCRVIVANADRIELTSVTNLLEENHDTEMMVFVYEVHGHKFPASDLRFMNIQLGLDTDSEYQRNNALRISRVPEEFHKFTVQGRITGDYRLIASASVSEPNLSGVFATRKIMSNAVDLHVFPTLVPNPPRLVLAPGCLTSIEILGGPSEKSKFLNGVELISRVNREDSIEIKQQDLSFFSVKGQKLGEVDVTFEVRYKNTGKILCEVTVPVRVALVDSVEILGMIDRKVHVGAQARLIAVTKAGGEVFRSALCPFSLTWASKHDNVLQIYSPSTTHIPCKDIAPPGRENSFQLENYNLAVNATAISAGVAEVELYLKTSYPSSDYKATHHTTTVKIRVINPLSIEVPTYIGNPSYSGAPTWVAGSVCTPVPPAHPALLVLPTNVDYQIKPNFANDRRLRYSVFSPTSNTRVSLSESGLLTTYGEKGKVSILIEDTEVDSEIIILDILITKVHSIFVENSYQVVTLPVDTDSYLKIHLQDSLGRAFPSPNELRRLSLSLSISNHHVLEGNLEEKNSLLRIRAKSEGLALCTVYLTDNPAIFDIFYVMVGSIITPASPVFVHQGGQVNFAVTSSAISNDVRNKWYAEDPSIVDINAYSGNALALKNGKTNIHFSDTIQYISKVNVFSIDKIILDAPIFKMTNVVDNEPHYRREYTIPFRVFSGDQEVKTLSTDTATINNNLDFQCAVSPQGWFIASPIITQQGDKQVPSCILRQAITPSPADQPIPSSITVTPTFTSRTKNVPFNYHQRFSFEFIGAFRVARPEKKQVVLNNRHHTSTIQIQTDDRDLTIHTSDRLSRYMTQYYENGYLNLKISIPPELKETISTEIEVSSLRTGQKEKIGVYYNQGAHVVDDIPSKPWNLNLADWVLITIVGVVIFSLLYTMNNYNQRRNERISDGVRVVQPAQPYPRGSNLGYSDNYFGTKFGNTSVSETPTRPGGLSTSQRSDLGNSRGSYSGFTSYRY